MNNSLDRLFDDIIRLLTDDVVPTLDSDTVRSQVYSAIFMLKNIRMRVDWAREPLLGQIRAQDALFEALAKDRLNGDVALPDATRLPVAPPSGAELMALRDSGNDLVARLIREAPPAAADHLVAYMRAELDMEMKATAKPMFAEMSAAKKD